MNTKKREVLVTLLLSEDRLKYGSLIIFLLKQSFKTIVLCLMTIVFLFIRYVTVMVLL